MVKLALHGDLLKADMGGFEGDPVFGGVITIVREHRIMVPKGMMDAIMPSLWNEQVRCIVEHDGGDPVLHIIDGLDDLNEMNPIEDDWGPMDEVVAGEPSPQMRLPLGGGPQVWLEVAQLLMEAVVKVTRQGVDTMEDRREYDALYSHVDQLESMAKGVHKLIQLKADKPPPA